MARLDNGRMYRFSVLWTTRLMSCDNGKNVSLHKGHWFKARVKGREGDGYTRVAIGENGVPEDQWVEYLVLRKDVKGTLTAASRAADTEEGDDDGGKVV